MSNIFDKWCDSLSFGGGSSVLVSTTKARLPRKGDTTRYVYPVQCYTGYTYIKSLICPAGNVRGISNYHMCQPKQAMTPKYNIFRRPTIFILYGFHSNQVGCFNKSESISNLYSMIIRKLNTTWLYRCVAIHSLAIRYANRQTLYRDAPVHR